MKIPTTHNIHLSDAEKIRYSRHISLPEIGINGQKNLKASSVLCVGSGGLGSPLLIYLAAAGIGRIGIVDFDIVESSNLQRQIIHKSSSIGLPKIESARSTIIEINPFCKVDIYKKILNKKNAIDIIKSFDIVCDCTDNFPSRYLINDACTILKKPNIYGSIAGFEGHATVFNLNLNSPNLRDLVPEPPPNELLPTCSEGVIGVLPGIIGLIQATEVIKIITQIGNPLNGRLLIFNALTMKFKEINIKANKQRNITDLIEYKGFCFNEENIKKEKSIEQVSVIDLKKHLLNHKNIILIDVRSPEEYKSNSINGAQLFPLNSIEDGTAISKIKKIVTDKKLYVHCQSGKRSLKALIILKSYGIIGTNIIGGINAWNKEWLNNNTNNIDHNIFT